MFYQSVRLLHHYFHKLFLLFDYNLTLKLGIWEIYDELTLNGQCPRLFTLISRFDLAGFQHAMHPNGNRYQLGPSFTSRRYQIPHFGIDQRCHYLKGF